MNPDDCRYRNLIQPIEDKIMNTIWRITRHREDAEDAFQETLLTIWKKLNKICAHPNPHALILRISVNCTYNLMLKKKRYKRNKNLSNSSADVSQQSQTIEEVVPGTDSQEEIFKAIFTLPKKQVQAALMRFIQEMPYKEIAEAMNCREATARKHVFRARKKLQNSLKHLHPYSKIEV